MRASKTTITRAPPLASAIAAKVPMPSSGKSRAIATPCATPHATRKPVNDPGPIPKAIPSRSAKPSPTLRKLESTRGSKVSEFDRPAGQLAAKTTPSRQRAIDPGSVAVSRAIMFMARILPVLSAAVFHPAGKTMQAPGNCPTANAGIKKPSPIALGSCQGSRSTCTAAPVITTCAAMISTTSGATIATIATVSTAVGRIDGTFRAPMLTWLGRTICSRLLRPRIRRATIWRARILPRPVVSRPLIPIGTPPSLHSGARPPLLLTVRLTIRHPISRSGTNFEFIQLVPLLVGTIPFRDSIQFANPATRVNRLGIIHVGIMNHSVRIIQHHRINRRRITPGQLMESPLSTRHSAL